MAKAFFNKTNAWCGFSTSNFYVILSSASPLLIDSSRNALYINRGSQQWKVTRFHHPNPRKEPAEQGLRCLRHAVIEDGELTFAPIDLQANCSEPLQ